ncbi:DNA-directed RNA polymerase subunit A' [Candidatus Woesearchaeota archaeon]|jgi:DNA-directed RNA polymerase subunit A'|nr:DNA-directed RNA polymerase subunit A' [Candidatus Woesearchaeota archaeon]
MIDETGLPQHPHKKVKSIVFGIMSPKLIKQMASAKVVTPELYDKEGYPVDGGLMDTRLGVIDPGLRCRTCGAKLKECPGHFGYIEMARPVIHINYVGLILTIIKCSCKECGKLLIPNNQREKILEKIENFDAFESLESRRKFITENVKSLKTINKCPHCKSRQQKITLEKPSTFLEADKRISPIEIRTRLEKLSEDDVNFLGFNAKQMRPEWLILTVLPIPPVTMRPSITLESGERSEDDITHKMGDIVRINQRLFENINAGAPEIIIEDLWDLLQYHVTTFFNNEVPQLPPARHRSGQPLKTIAERIKSKEGRIRHNLAGKRTNFSARTVISPDPMIELNEVGVPMIVATKLTVPERMTEWNSAYLKKFIENGAKKYPGANYVVRPDGKKKKITDDMKEAILEEIQPGYMVERHLMDGDIAIFNRQPSLHRMSMMCHRVRVLPGRTFRLNPTVCNPYNADFDGDEMNLHIPQTEEARAEAQTLMQVQTQLISPGFGLSVIGCIQDAVSGNYVLTKLVKAIPRKKAVDILMKVGIEDYSRLPKKEIITGNELFSMLLPEGLTYYGKTMSKDEIEIVDGQLKKGYMDRLSLGEAKGLLLRHIHKKYGDAYTAGLIARIQKLGIFTLKYTGFTTSIADTDLPKIAQEKIEEILTDSYTDVDKLIESFNKEELETFPGKSMQETLELKILERLNKARNETGKIVDEYSTKETGTIMMSRSGARGKPLNLAQMAACVGQQAMRGGRIIKGYKGRTLSCFKRGDLTPSARGFIRRGFKQGLKPHEFFFMGMTGRDSLMDTALRTPKSGYLYRRLANAMQDIKVDYDNTVRNASHKIIQFKYGEDGIDVCKSVGGKLDIKGVISEVIHAKKA